LEACALSLLDEFYQQPPQRHVISAAALNKTFTSPTRQLEFKACAQTPNSDNKIMTLVDTGASACFVSRSWVKQQLLKPMKLNRPITLALANGKVVDSLTDCVELQIRHGDHHSKVLCHVTDIGKYTIILGMNWMDDHQPTLTFGLDERSMRFASRRCLNNCCSQGMPETIYDNHRIPESGTRKDTLVGRICIITAEVAKLTALQHPDQVIWIEPHEWEKHKEPLWPPDDYGKEHCSTINQADFDKYMEKYDRPPMSDEEIQKLVPQWVYERFKDIFNPVAADQLPPRRKGVDHHIKTEGPPPRPKLYGLTRQETEAVKAYIDDMLGRGFIRPSTSPYASPVLVVKKPGGGLRICVDYRQLNEVTKKNRNSPPAIKETLARMAKTKVMTLVDVVAAFNTVRLAEEDEEKTAFLTRYGLYEYRVMPFGLCNAPGTFQTFINETLRDYLDDFCTAYLDDILIYSENEEDHEEHVFKVLQRLKNVNLFLDPKKCSWKTKRVKYLGLILTPDGIEMDPKKVATILEWKQPRCVKDVQAFLGFCNFYRRFIKGYSHLAKPLMVLTRKEDGTKKFPLPPDSPSAQAFDKLKKAFTEAGVLAHFDPDLETWLETDASDFITAAVLSQMHNGVLRPVAFLSHKMTPAECNYEIYDKELLAIVMAFEEWRFELSGTNDPISVLSDHQALQTFMTTKRLNRRQARWAEFLAEFNFKVKYRPGKQGTKPDALTRRPGDLPEGTNDERSQHQVQVVIKPDQVDPNARVATITTARDGGSKHAVYLARCYSGNFVDSPVYLAQMMCSLQDDDEANMPLCADQDVPNNPAVNEHPVEEQPDVMSLIRATAADDSVLQALIKAKQAGHRRIPHDLLHGHLRLRIELSECSIRDSLLYIRDRIYVPEGARTVIIEQAHRSLVGGHSGKHESYAKLVQWYYWPRMTSDISQYVRNCLICKRTKSYRDGKHGLLHPLPIPERYWSCISMDFITHLPPCSHNGQVFTNILVIVDRLTKKKKFIPMNSLTVDALVQAFIEYIWREEGYPEEIISDRGSQFVAYFWRRLCQRLGTHPKFSSAFHPQTDGQTENANAYLKQYLRAYVNYQQDNWALFLPMAEFEANSTVSATTGYSPFFATKGYQPRSGIEPAKPVTGTTPAKCEQLRADQLADKLHKLRDELRNSMRWAQAKQAEYANDNRLPAPQFKVNDLVLLDTRNIRTTRPNQSLDHKNRGPFRIARVIDHMAYELELPPSMGRIHNVFHPWLLHLYENSPLPGQTLDEEEPAEFNPEADDDMEYTVEAIIDCRINNALKDPHAKGRGKDKSRGLLQYMVKWADYPLGDDNPSWEPYMNLTESSDLVFEYHQRHPGAPPIHKTFQTMTGKQNVLLASTSTSLTGTHCGDVRAAATAN
jgi:hypothetical protein